MPCCEFGGENLDTGDVNRDQNNSQHEHAQSETDGHQCSQIDVHAGRAVDETTGELRAENRDDAQQREAKKLEETAKIDPECLIENISARRFRSCSGGWVCRGSGRGCRARPPPLSPQLEPRGLPLKKIWEFPGSPSTEPRLHYPRRGAAPPDKHRLLA